MINALLFAKIQSMHTKAMFPVLLILLSALLYSPAADAEEKPITVLKELTLGGKEISGVLQRKVVTKTLDTSDRRELAVLGVMMVETSPENIVNAVRDITKFKQGKEVISIGKFEHFTPEEMKNLALDEDEISALAECEVQDCGFKLPADWIEKLRDAKHKPDQLRELLASYANDYNTRGKDSVVKYNNKEDALDSQKEFENILKASPYLKTLDPKMNEYLLSFPDKPPTGAEHFLYWSREKFGFKPVISMTHVTIAPWTGEGVKGWVIASRQIFADHYYDASLGLTFLLQRDTEKDNPATFLVYVNRSRVDILGGFLSSLRRAIAIPRIRSGMETHMKGFRMRLEDKNSARSQSN